MEKFNLKIGNTYRIKKISISDCHYKKWFIKGTCKLVDVKIKEGDRVKIGYDSYQNARISLRNLEETWESGSFKSLERLAEAYDLEEVDEEVNLKIGQTYKVKSIKRYGGENWYHKGNFIHIGEKIKEGDLVKIGYDSFFINNLSLKSIDEYWESMNFSNLKNIKEAYDLEESEAYFKSEEVTEDTCVKEIQDPITKEEYELKRIEELSNAISSNVGGDILNVDKLKEWTTELYKRVLDL
jgi:translation initiation factor IF-1